MAKIYIVGSSNHAKVKAFKVDRENHADLLVYSAKKKATPRQMRCGFLLIESTKLHQLCFG